MKEKIILFEPDLIFCDVLVRDKTECLSQMTSLLVRKGVITDKEVFLKGVMEREAIMSTGIGRQVALPHGRSNLVTSVKSVVYLLKTRIDFQSVDDEPVQFIVLTASPESESHVYMLMLRHLTEYLRIPQNREKLFAVTDKTELLKIMKGIENEVNQDLTDS